MLMLKIFIGTLIFHDAHNRPIDIVMEAFLIQGYVTMVSQLLYQL